MFEMDGFLNNRIDMMKDDRGAVKLRLEITYNLQAWMDLLRLVCEVAPNRNKRDAVANNVEDVKNNGK